MSHPNARDVRGPKNPNFKHGRYVDERAYREMVDTSKCSRCGTTEGVVDVHHKNGDHEDDRLENLEPVCHACHARHHRIEEGPRRGERWALDHDACSRCGTTERRHAGHGLCSSCFYLKRRACADCGARVGLYSARCRACNMRRVRSGAR